MIMMYIIFLSLKSYFHIKGCRLFDYKAEALSRKKICISAVQTCKQASVSNSILWRISDVLLLQCRFFKPFHITIPVSGIGEQFRLSAASLYCRPFMLKPFNSHCGSFTLKPFNIKALSATSFPTWNWTETFQVNTTKALEECNMIQYVANQTTTYQETTAAATRASRDMGTVQHVNISHSCLYFELLWVALVL